MDISVLNILVVEFETYYVNVKGTDEQMKGSSLLMKRIKQSSYTSRVISLVFMFSYSADTQQWLYGAQVNVLIWLTKCNFIKQLVEKYSQQT